MTFTDNVTLTAHLFDLEECKYEFCDYVETADGTAFQGNGSYSGHPDGKMTSYLFFGSDDGSEYGGFKICFAAVSPPSPPPPPTAPHSPPAPPLQPPEPPLSPEPETEPSSMGAIIAISIALFIAACMAVLFCYCGCCGWFLAAAAPAGCEEDPPDKKRYPKAYASWLQDCCGPAPDKEKDPAAYERWRRKCDEREQRDLTQWGGQSLRLLPELLALKS